MIANIFKYESDNLINEKCKIVRIEDKELY